MLNSNQDGRRLVDANTHYELHIQYYQEKPLMYKELLQAQTKGSLISFDGYDVAIIKGGRIVTFYEGISRTKELERSESDLRVKEDVLVDFTSKKPYKSTMI